ncbi:Bug family tripartite tricarboxylate transporter substrate binding protein [Delftia sp. PS-11]|uniref:Bug family tripartite tricarboxylate transporter substrate binding protein n=1 Tax=Delftia sp. PS-11 TaxID=2767222 RepID=UPI00245892B0|nr:tripartite tricarboxylate transporter substrate binding protein [Delftia sp. PS-11]KAJ8744808.1 tripartite tricarboxylate transporter substrate binding protein [Delftia sp. PS-11]
MDCLQPHPAPWTRRLWLCAASAALAASALPGHAQQRRAMRLVVPFAPGGGNDVFARQMAHGLNEVFGYGMIVENKAGAGGNLGTESVVRAAPDGTTYLLGHTGTVSINPSLYAGLKFNAASDLQPVAMFASSALLLVVPASSPMRSVADLAEQLRKRGGEMTFASSGSGTGGHLTGEMFAHALGARAIHVPYKGTAPSLTDLAGGNVDFSFGVIPAAMALVRAGRLRALAVTGARRQPQLPDVPAIAESGVRALADFESSLTYGILAPKGTPAESVRALGRDILKVAASESFQSRLGIEGAVPLLGDADQYAARIRQESAKWAAVIKASGATA